MTIKSTAKHSIIRGCLSRYELALKAASKITSLDKHTFFNDNSDKDDGSDDSRYDFIISAHLTIPDNGYRVLHNWIFSSPAASETLTSGQNIRYNNLLNSTPCSLRCFLFDHSVSSYCTYRR